MKLLTLSGLVLVLAASSGTALADRGGWKGGHGKGHYKHGHYSRHWYPRPYYRTVYYYPYHDHHYRDDYYAPLGAALIGAAVTYSIFHGHDSYSGSSSSDVVGCHRIERYPNGSERRVEVPLAECY